MNKQITSHQLYALTATISLGGSILVSSAAVSGVAKQDAWIAALIAVCYGVPVMLLYYFLGSKYPGLTLLGIIKKILGKWLGFIVCTAYVLMFVNIAMHLPWYIGSYFGRILHETPVSYINIIFVAGIVIAVLYGIETIARVSEIFITLFVIIIIILVLLLIKDIKPDYLTPVMENGIVPPLKGSVILSSYITFSSINILMIFPRHVGDMPNAKKALVKGFLVSGGISFATILLSVLVLGSSLIARTSYPTLMLASEINIGAFISRMEYILTMIWLCSQFMIGVAFFYSAITSLSEMLGLKNHKKIAGPFGLLVLIMSEVIFSNAIYQSRWVNIVYTPLITTFGVMIPLMLMVVYVIRKKLFRNLI